MATRQVTRSRKDADGDITALCNPGAPWSPRLKADAIRDIETGLHQYYVNADGSGPATIHVVNGPRGKYLRTTADRSSRNNLDNLPDC
ncbi:MAG: DUF3892 domain-containing protein [Pseudomonadota bacterium]